MKYKINNIIKLQNRIIKYKANKSIEILNIIIK